MICCARAYVIFQCICTMYCINCVIVYEIMCNIIQKYQIIKSSKLLAFPKL